MSTSQSPRVLAELAGRAARATAEEGGALWRLSEPDRQLDANLVRLAPDAAVGQHVEDDVDVLLLVIEGSGHIDGPAGGLPLEPHILAWLPRSSRRGLRAGPDGLAYLTVHRRRPALGIKKAPASGIEKAPVPAATEGGEAPCMLERVCVGCGRISPDLSDRYCGRCGEPLPAREG